MLGARIAVYLNLFQIITLILSDTDAGGKNVFTGGQPLTAAVGTEARLVCPAETVAGVASSVSWRFVDQSPGGGPPLPAGATEDSGVLIIKGLTREHGGIYTCTITTDQGQQVRLNVSLHVADFVPYFNGDSYVVLGGLPTQAYKQFEIRMSFRPTAENGLLFYTVKEVTDEGDSSDQGDFISVALKDARVVYTFDLGAGPVQITSALPVRLNRWNTVVFKRTNNEGTLVVNDEDEQMGVGSPESSGLGLGAVVYLGGAPDYETLPVSVTPREGFRGDVSIYVVNGDLVDIGEASREVGVSGGARLAAVCATRPCLHGGQCVPAHRPDGGYKCVCLKGTYGTNCEKTANTCVYSGGVCAADSSCVDMGESAHICLCPMNRTGADCAEEIAVGGSPRFDGTHSYISYARPTPSRRAFKMSFRIRPDLVKKDAVVLYMGDTLKGDGDFFALAIVDRSLQLILKKNDEVLRVKNDKKILANEQYSVEIERIGGKTTLSVNGASVTESFSDSDDYLHLNTDLFLGGVSPGTVLPIELTTMTAFDGCVLTPVKLNDAELALIREAKDAANIGHCHSVEACAPTPCIEGATCLDNGDATFTCICPEGVAECEASKTDACQPNPCDNKGLCRPADGGSACDCIIGFNGDSCENFLPVETNAFFNGQAYVQFPSKFAPHDSSETEELITMNIKTTADTGLILWHGPKPEVNAHDEDHMSIGLDDGYLKFSYELGGGPVHLHSKLKVNDNKKHVVKVWRQGRKGKLTVDGEEKTDNAGGILAMLNANGPIFVGGAPNIVTTTAGTYSANFTGCIGDLVLPKPQRVVDFAEDSESGFNVVPCEDWDMNRWRRRLKLFW